ncbi:HotDog domain-containing protein [Hypoxylon cercidicola]|nr:HotDog domain-containing protein [Hypoxylon cercidicola]
MKVPRSLCQFQKLQRCSFSLPRHCPPVWSRTYSSNSSDGFSQGKFDSIRAEMLERPAQLSWDVMSPTNSSLLNIALADFIPEDCQAPAWRAGAMDIESVDPATKLPQGHHLVYFPLQNTASELCPDGTDPLHSPGGPFERRMWAGGSIVFDDDFRLDSRSVVCREYIDDVTVKGPAGQEKIFVDVLREYMRKEDFENTRLRGRPMAQGIRERRGLVFMRGISREQARENLAIASKGRGRTVKAPNAPDISISLTPTPTLLFHYSALTFNAHLIHLDPEFCREVEGHRNLLFHGPLSLTLMLSLLRSQLDPDEKVYKIDYRNLAPLYVNEPLRVCLRQIGREDGSVGGGKSRRWEVWVEGQDGGLSVRGTAMSLGSGQ